MKKKFVVLLSALLIATNCLYVSAAPSTGVGESGTVIVEEETSEENSEENPEEDVYEEDVSEEVASEKEDLSEEELIPDEESEDNLPDMEETEDDAFDIGEDELGYFDESETEILSSCPSGIKNNGSYGINIDINAHPYTTYQNKAAGSYAYGSSGCAWFAAARHCQLTGREYNIWSGQSWWNNHAAQKGYAKGSECRAYSFACYTNHIAVVEQVSGNNVVITEGGTSAYSDADHGYCTIRQTTISALQKSGTKKGDFLGYVYFAEGPKNPKIAFDYAGQDEKGNILVTGWAFDEDDVNQAIAVHVYAYMNKDYNTPYFVGETIANVYRSDVNDAFGCGNYHGFSASFPPPVYGTVEVNVAAINIGSGDNVWSTAKTITVEKRGLAIISDNFPDANFRSAITEYFDKDKNGFLSDEELAGATEIRVSDCSDFSGIERFSQLNKIGITNYNVSLKKLNFDRNAKLKEVNIVTGEDISYTEAVYDNNHNIIGYNSSNLIYDPNSLHYLNFGNNPELEILKIASGSITNIGIEKNANLKELKFCGSRIESLDVSNNVKLEKLTVGGENSSFGSTSYAIKAQYSSSIKSIKINGAKNLRTLTIGSCTLADEISVVDCDQLESISMYWGGHVNAKRFVVKNNESLKTIYENSGKIQSGGYVELSNNPALTMAVPGILYNEQVVIRNNPSLNFLFIPSPGVKELNIGDGNPILVSAVKACEQPQISSGNDYNRKSYSANGDSLIVAENTVVITDKVILGNITISGDYKYGQVLTANVTECNVTTLSYQWMRGTAIISGATSNTYKLVAADIGKKISCIVTDASGDAIGSISSLQTDKIAKADSPAAPSGVKGVPTSQKGRSDGKITGVTTAMEYSLQENFSGGGIACTSTTVTGLKAGTYYVRLKETKTTKAGKAARVVVEEGKEKADVTLIFEDVKAGSWYVNAVQYVYDKGIMSGTGANTFSPNSSLTRGQLVTILYSMAGKPKTTYKANFDDVKQSDYFALPVTWAYANGITSGNGNGTFSPNQNITREQLAVMLYKYASVKNYNLTSFSKALDVFSDKGKVSSYATDAMKWAVTQEIISGKGDGKLDPKGTATRAECAAMVMKLLQKNGQ